MDFSGKVIWITGGARGIGLATAKLYAKAGGIVVIGDLNLGQEGILTPKKDCENIYETPLDVTNEENARQLAALMIRQFGRIDILVNNAGICRNAMAFEEMPLSSWESMFAVNTFGSVNCAKAVIPYMKKQQSGSIIMSSSIAAEIGAIRTEASYGASKAANICIMMTLAKYLGPYNITVNGVAPGIIDTEMTRALDPADMSTIPLGRAGMAEDVANTILYLTSRQGSYLTGVMVDVNGGMHMR